MNESPFNPQLRIPSENGYITAKDFFRNIFPPFMLKFLSENSYLKDKYEILDKITRTTQKDLTGKEHLFLKIDYRSYKDEKYSTSGITESWAAMLKDRDPRVREIARFLFYYSFHINGTDMHIYSFMNLAPNILKLKVPVNNNETYASFFRNLRDGQSIDIVKNQYDFLKEYMINDINNPLFTKIIYDKDTKKELLDLCIVNGYYKKTFTVDTPDLLSKLIKKNDDTITCSPIINVGNNYYMSVDYNGNPKYLLGSENEPIVYEHIIPSNLANVLLELDGKESAYSYHFDENFGTYLEEDFAYSEEDIINAIYYLIDTYNRNSNGPVKEAEVVVSNSKKSGELYKTFLSLVGDVYKMSQSTAPILEAYSILNRNNSSINAFNKDNFLKQLDIFGGEMNIESDYLRKATSEFKENVNNGDVSNIIDTFNGLYNFYKKNNNSFVVDIDGELVKLC
jgi:hypothetical protein